MTRPPTRNVQVTFRIPESDAIAAERLADFLSEPGHRASRNDGLRAALARGLASYLADMEAAEKTSK